MMAVLAALAATGVALTGQAQTPLKPSERAPQDRIVQDEAADRAEDGRSCDEATGERSSECEQRAGSDDDARKEEPPVKAKERSLAEPVAASSAELDSDVAGDPPVRSMTRIRQATAPESETDDRKKEDDGDSDAEPDRRSQTEQTATSDSEADTLSPR